MGTYIRPIQRCYFEWPLVTWQNIQWHEATRGLSATAEILVQYANTFYAVCLRSCTAAHLLKCAFRLRLIFITFMLCIHWQITELQIFINNIFAIAVVDKLPPSIRAASMYTTTVAGHGRMTEPRGTSGYSYISLNTLNNRPTDSPWVHTEW